MHHLPFFVVSSIMYFWTNKYFFVDAQKILNPYVGSCFIVPIGCNNYHHVLFCFIFFSESFYSRNATTLGSSYRSTYSSTDYASAVRRSSLFDGYAGFSIYSSISQGNIFEPGNCLSHCSILNKKYSSTRDAPQGCEGSSEI